MKKAVWAGFLGGVLVAVVLLKIWDVAVVVEQGASWVNLAREESGNAGVETYVCPDGSFERSDTHTKICEGATHIGTLVGEGDYAQWVNPEVLGIRSDEIIPWESGDITPLQVTDSGGLKAYGRYQGEMVEGWVPIAVDKEGRVICSQGSKP